MNQVYNVFASLSTLMMNYLVPIRYYFLVYKFQISNMLVLFAFSKDLLDYIIFRLTPDQLQIISELFPKSFLE